MRLPSEIARRATSEISTLPVITDQAVERIIRRSILEGVEAAIAQYRGYEFEPASVPAFVGELISLIAEFEKALPEVNYPDAVNRLRQRRRELIWKYQRKPRIGPTREQSSSSTAKAV